MLGQNLGHTHMCKCELNCGLFSHFLTLQVKCHLSIQWHICSTPTIFHLACDWWYCVESVRDEMEIVVCPDLRYWADTREIQFWHQYSQYLDMIFQFCFGGFQLLPFLLIWKKLRFIGSKFDFCENSFFHSLLSFIP